MRPVIMIVAAFLAAPFTSVIAQEQPPPLEPGQRVRVSAPAAFGGAKQVATFEALRGDPLVVAVDSLTRLIPFDVLTRFEVSRGERTAMWTGAIVGAATVAVSPLGAVGYGAEDATDALNIIAGSAAVGALLGAFVGLAIRTDRWEEVPLDQLPVGVGPQRDGRLGLGLSVRF